MRSIRILTAVRLPAFVMDGGDSNVVCVSRSLIKVEDDFDMARFKLFSDWDGYELAHTIDDKVVSGSVGEYDSAGMELDDCDPEYTPMECVSESKYYKEIVGAVGAINCDLRGKVSSRSMDPSHKLFYVQVDSFTSHSNNDIDLSEGYYNAAYCNESILVVDEGNHNSVDVALDMYRKLK